MVDGPMQATKDAMVCPSSRYSLLAYMASDLRGLSTQAVGKASSSVASAMMTQLETERQTEVEELVARQLPSNMSVIILYSIW